MKLKKFVTYLDFCFKIKEKEKKIKVTLYNNNAYINSLRRHFNKLHLYFNFLYFMKLFIIIIILSQEK
jgi:hypothetical protein